MTLVDRFVGQQLIDVQTNTSMRWSRCGNGGVCLRTRD